MKKTLEGEQTGPMSHLAKFAAGLGGDRRRENEEADDAKFWEALHPSIDSSTPVIEQDRPDRPIKKMIKPDTTP